MDRTYIASQHIVERYLSGDLTVREARDFEKFCGENPDILNSLPIPVRVKARMARKPGADLAASDFDPTATDTSIVAAGLDDSEDDDDEPPVRGFKGLPQEARRWAVMLGVALAVALVGAAALWVRVGNLETQLASSQRAAKAVQLRAPGSVQEYRVRPTAQRGAASVNIGLPNPPQLVDLRVDMTDTKYNTFLVTLENADLGRVMQIRRVARDSNRELRLSLNSSAFSAGDYDVKLEGYTWNGATVAVGWVRLGMK